MQTLSQLKQNLQVPLSRLIASRERLSKFGLWSTAIPRALDVADGINAINSTLKTLSDPTVISQPQPPTFADIEKWWATLPKAAGRDDIALIGGAGVMAPAIGFDRAARVIMSFAASWLKPQDPPRRDRRPVTQSRSSVDTPRIRLNWNGISEVITTEEAELVVSVLEAAICEAKGIGRKDRRSEKRRPLQEAFARGYRHALTIIGKRLSDISNTASSVLPTEF